VERHLWWQKGIIYQVYPASFMDSNGDGFGDLAGITDRLDYLHWLGVDALWISPIYPSPMVDLGYDISDYRNIHPAFGAMPDFDRLLGACHKRKMKLILDFVPNHTSDRHPWFQESRSSRDNPRRDWYIWRSPDAAGRPPNNWLSNFGEGAWEWDPATGQYYYHAFYRAQPDLNWRNPQVQEAMLSVMRFWLRKGVDGFRVDVMWHLIKDRYFRDNPPNPDYSSDMLPSKQFIETYSADQADVLDIVTMMRAVIDDFDQRLLIGEVYLSVDELIDYYGRQQSLGAHLPYNFQLIVLPWKAANIYVAINKYEGSLPEFAWPNWVLGNHDKDRIATRIGPEQARVAALLLLTLRGTPTIYYGEEIGMRNVVVPPERVRDPVEKMFPGQGYGRDPQRAPMQWDSSPHAGFSSVEPWLPMAEDCREVNVENQKRDENSMLMFYHRLIHLRQNEPALRVGRYRPACVCGNVFGFFREYGETRFLIAVNLGHEEGRMILPGHLRTQGEVVMDTHPDRIGRAIGDEIDMAGDEGLIAAVR
jgi:alpha-glucosidase